MGRGVGCAVEGLPMGAGKKEGQGVRGEVVGAAAALNRFVHLEGRSVEDLQGKVELTL